MQRIMFRMPLALLLFVSNATLSHADIILNIDPYTPGPGLMGYVFEVDPNDLTGQYDTIDIMIMALSGTVFEGNTSTSPEIIPNNGMIGPDALTVPALNSSPSETGVNAGTGLSTTGYTDNGTELNVIFSDTSGGTNLASNGPRELVQIVVPDDFHRFEYAVSVADDGVQQGTTIMNTIAVPEPSLVILWGVGCLGFIAVKMKRWFVGSP